MRRRIEATRDRIFDMCGTTEAVIAVSDGEMTAEVGREFTSAQWRKPCSIEEVARLAPTVEVRERRGRP
jgi:hypothetical protein